MRVLEQHPVQLTFFFVPQVVQALRTDTLGESASSVLTSMRSNLSLTLPSFLFRLRLRRAIHLRDLQGFSALLPSDHLEHEGQLLQGRLGFRGKLFTLSTQTRDEEHATED